MQMLRVWMSAAIACAMGGAALGVAASTHHPDPAPGVTSIAAAAEALTEAPDSGADLIGTPAPAWEFNRWIGTKPLSLAKLRGKVVLLRWWTEGCHFCSATLPDLERLRTAEAANGLVVIGVFHPKPPRAVSDRRIASLARRLGFKGPIAVDEQWNTLERYWLAGHPEHNWTSVSFLIDKSGNIRWVHGGGEYHPSQDPHHARCDLSYRELQRAIEAAEFEPSAAQR